MSSFAAQTSFAQAISRGFAGMIASSAPVHIVPARSATRKLVSVVITASNSQVYTITINGVDFAYTADGSALTTEIALGLKALINAGSQPVLASGVDTPLLIESTIDGVDGDFTYADSAGTGALVETVVVAQCQAIPFGFGVCFDERSTDPDAVRLPRQSSDVTGLRFAGVTVAENYAKVAHAELFPANSKIPVARKGQYLVKVEEAVSNGDQPYVRYAAGGLGLGAFRKSTGTSEAAALPSAVYRSAAAINGLAVLEVNFV